MRLIELKTGLSRRQIVLAQVVAFSMSLSFFLPQLGVAAGWSVPIVALFQLPRRTLFSDPRTYGLAGLAFWSLREVGGTVIHGFPADSQSSEAVLYVGLLSGCSLLILAMFRLSATITIRPPQYRPGFLLAIRGIGAAVLVAAYVAIPQDSEFLLPAEVVILSIFCGGLICYRGGPLVVCALALFAIWIFDASVSVNRSGLLQTPAFALLSVIFRQTFFGQSERLLKPRYAMVACLVAGLAAPLSLSTKEGFGGDNYSSLQRLESFYSGEVEFPFFADPQRYFAAFADYRSVDTRGVSILTQIALSPLPRSAFPWKPPDIVHYLDTIGVGEFLYIETFLLPIADLGLPGVFLYALMPALIGYSGLALLAANRRAYPHCYGMMIPIFYCVFMSQSGYPFSIAQYQLAPLAILGVTRVYDAARGRASVRSARTVRGTRTALAVQARRPIRSE